MQFFAEKRNRIFAAIGCSVLLLSVIYLAVNVIRWRSFTPPRNNLHELDFRVECVS